MPGLTSRATWAEPIGMERPDRLDEESVPPPKKSALPAVLLGAVLVTAVGVGVWSFKEQLFGSKEPPPAPVTDAGFAPADSGETRPLDMAEGDRLLRSLAPTMTTSKELLSWLETGEIVKRIVTSVILMAQGRSPRSALPFLQLDEFFKPKRLDQPKMDSATYARYDRFMRVVESVDASEAASIYLVLKPYLAAAFDAGAAPGENFEADLARSIGLVSGVEVPREPIRLLPKGATYLFADPKLEALRPLQKHVLRLGPDHAASLQKKLKEFAAKAGIRPDAAASSSGGSESVR